MSIKRKLMKATDWFLLGRGGDVFLILALLGFCLLVAMACLLMGTGIDNQDKPVIDRTGYYNAIWI